MKRYIFFAFLAAILYSISIPISKLLLDGISPTFLASFLYLGAGIGIFVLKQLNKKQANKENSLKKNDLIYVILMVVLDILAPILLMFGLKASTSENTSLLNNFEIVATTMIAYFVFKEPIKKNLLFGIILIFIASIFLSVEKLDFSTLNFSYGSLLVILATVCWGIENNCTRKLSFSSPYQIVIIKGLFSGIGSFIIALILNDTFPKLTYILIAMVLGFIAYGLSIFFYVKAQRGLGASKTSAFYAFAPFIGTILSCLIFMTIPNYHFFIAFIIMIIGAYFVSYNDYRINLKKYKNFIFDLYGTIVDIKTDESIDLLWEKLALDYRKIGVHYTPQEIHETYLKLCDKHVKKLIKEGNTMPEIELKNVFIELSSLKGVIITDEQIKQISINFRVNSTMKIGIYDSVINLLQTLKKLNKKIYLLSNAQSLFTNYELEKLDLNKYFDGIVLSSDEGIKKPSPEFFDRLFKKYELNKEDSIMIGNDRTSDILGAHEYGIDSIYINSNISPENDLHNLSFAIKNINDGKIEKIINYLK